MEFSDACIAVHGLRLKNGYGPKGERVGSSKSLLAPEICPNVPKIGSSKVITRSISYSMAIDIYNFWETQIDSKNFHSVKHIEDLVQKVF